MPDVLGVMRQHQQADCEPGCYHINSLISDCLTPRGTGYFYQSGAPDFSGRTLVSLLSRLLP